MNNKRKHIIIILGYFDKQKQTEDDGLYFLLIFEDYKLNPCYYFQHINVSPQPDYMKFK